MFLTVNFMSPFLHHYNLWLPEFKPMFWPMDYTSLSTGKLTALKHMLNWKHTLHKVEE